MSEQQPPSLEQFGIKLQDEIILSQSRAQQVAINSFNQVFQQLQQAMQVLGKEQAENNRLRILCEKNKIDTKIDTKVATNPVVNIPAKSPPTENKIAPVVK